jgi:hypothetical protein
MLTKTTNVSGSLKTASDMFVNVSFNYRNDSSELRNIDFNFNKNDINVFGSYNIQDNRIINYSVNNGIIDASILAEVKTLCGEIAEDPDASALYEEEPEA